jgi:hypothetical protein
MRGRVETRKVSITPHVEAVVYTIDSRMSRVARVTRDYAFQRYYATHVQGQGVVSEECNMEDKVRSRSCPSEARDAPCEEWEQRRTSQGEIQDVKARWKRQTADELKKIEGNGT